MKAKRKTSNLCPGKKQLVKHPQDLGAATFRNLVTRRARQLNIEADLSLRSSETHRKKLEKKILEKVNRTADFLPASFLEDGASRASSVCRIVLPRSLGTGFLVARNFIMTNHHVLRAEAAAEGATAQFDFETGKTPIMVALRPDRFFVTDRELDFTIVACEGRGIEEIPTVQLRRNPALVTRSERVNIIQHPRGRNKEIAIHDNHVERVMSSVLKYKTDTEPGSSGSPVFNNDWELVALHHAGIQRAGGRATNEGIRISAIVDHLLNSARREESAGSQDALRRLLGSVVDSSPSLGFFDTAGLPKTDLEIQVNDFQGVPDFADVGVWNIEHFNRNVSNQRVRDVAQVVNRLNLDIMGLTEVDTGALNRLVASLTDSGSRFDFVLRDTRGAQDIAVLFDTDTTQVTRRSDIADRHVSRLRRRTSANQTAFPRWPLFAQCRVGDSNSAVEFIMIVVHLKAFGDAQSRARRRLAAEILAEIVQDIRTTEGLPVVLGGDFNERLDNDVLSSVSDTPDLFALTADDATDGAISYVGNSHRSLIDHVIVSRDVRLGSISGDDAAIVRLDRAVGDFADRVSDHVPIVFRMIMRDRPANVTPSASSEFAVDVPDGAVRLRLDFE